VYGALATIDILNGRFEVLTSATKKITLAWNERARNPVDGFLRMRGTRCV
jgi:hypothetical protein